MIDYVEIRNKSARELIGIIDTAQSIIWKSSFYDVGEFEIYTEFTDTARSLLVPGNYVTRPDNEECGVIERVEISGLSDKMIIASGRFVKSILDRRIVYFASRTGTGDEHIWTCQGATLSGNVELAVRGLIYYTAINAAGFDPIDIEKRNIPEIYWTNDDISGITKTITTGDSSEQDAEKQVTYKNLFDYTESVLKEYEIGAKMWLDLDRLLFRYKIYQGVDRSADNTGGNNPVIFSADFDNLESVSYIFDNSLSKNTALVGGEGEGISRKCAFFESELSGLDRREVFVDASSISTTYKEGDVDKEYPDSVYRKMLETQGRQSVGELQQTESFDGTIDATNSQFKYGIDYNLGDLVTVQDKDIGKYINTRVLSVTECQNETGYNIDVEYGN